MNLDNHRQAENTRGKIRLLEERCRIHEADPGEMTYARALTLRSLRRMINRMKEEVIRFESRAATALGRDS